MSIDTGNPPSSPSPLWIIALFIALSEAMASVAAIATDGVPRLTFASFAAGFPILVLAVFVWMLLKHPANLYSPGQYTQVTTVGDFVQALSRTQRDRETVVTEAVIEGVINAVGAKSRSVAGTDARSIRQEVSESIKQAIDQASVMVDRSPILDGADAVQIPVTSETKVDSLLDSIYFTIADAVKPFTYGEAWVLADEHLKFFDEMGTRWAQKRGSQRDTRPLQEVGIQPGSRLLVLPKRRTAFERPPSGPA